MTLTSCSFRCCFHCLLFSPHSSFSSSSPLSVYSICDQFAIYIVSITSFVLHRTNVGVAKQGAQWRINGLIYSRSATNLRGNPSQRLDSTDVQPGLTGSVRGLQIQSFPLSPMSRHVPAVLIVSNFLFNPTFADFWLVWELLWDWRCWHEKQAGSFQF